MNIEETQSSIETDKSNGIVLKCEPSPNKLRFLVPPKDSHCCANRKPSVDTFPRRQDSPTTLFVANYHVNRQVSISLSTICELFSCSFSL